MSDIILKNDLELTGGKRLSNGYLAMVFEHDTNFMMEQAEISVRMQDSGDDAILDLYDTDVNGEPKDLIINLGTLTPAQHENDWDYYVYNDNLPYQIEANKKYALVVRKSGTNPDRPWAGLSDVNSDPNGFITYVSSSGDEGSWEKNENQSADNGDMLFIITGTELSSHIKGVVNLNSNPIEGAVVRLVNQDTNSYVDSVTTNSAGEYTFEELEDGVDYHVTVEYLDGSTDEKYYTKSAPYIKPWEDEE